MEERKDPAVWIAEITLNRAEERLRAARAAREDAARQLMSAAPRAPETEYQRLKAELRARRCAVRNIEQTRRRARRALEAAQLIAAL